MNLDRKHSISLILFFAAALLPLSTSACIKSGGGAGFGITGKAKFGVETTIVIDRLELTFPAAAIANPAGVNVQVQFSKVFPAGGIAIGPRFVILPQDIVFAAPVTVTFSYKGLALPNGVAENQLKLVRLGATGVTTDLPTVLDTDEDTATTTLTEFLTIALLAPSTTPPLNGTGSVVFLRNDINGDADIWTCDPDGSNITLVTAHTPGEIVSSPRVSTVASRVAFTESVGGDPNNTRVWIVNINGTGRTQVTADSSIESVGDLTINGDLLFVTTRQPNDALTDVAVYILSGGAPFPRSLLTDTGDEAEHDPRISPDGSLLLFLDGKSHLRKMAPTLGAKVQFLTKQPVASFAFRPDGERVVVERPSNLLSGFIIGGGLGEITIKSSGTTFLPKIKGTSGARNPTYSPNGLHLLFEFTDADRGVSLNTIRQIAREGGTHSVFFAGASTFFVGEVPHARN